VIYIVTSKQIFYVMMLRNEFKLNAVRYQMQCDCARTCQLDLLCLERQGTDSSSERCGRRGTGVVVSTLVVYVRGQLQQPCNAVTSSQQSPIHGCSQGTRTQNIFFILFGRKFVTVSQLTTNFIHHQQLLTNKIKQ